MTTADPSAVHVWLVLMKAHHALEQEAISSIEATGLCFSDFKALELLLHKGPVAINTLGSHLALTSGALTSVVDRLEKKGLVERHGDPNDRRVRIIKLTEPGQQLIRTLFNQHSQDMENALSHLNREERQRLIELLKKAGKQPHRNVRD